MPTQDNLIDLSSLTDAEYLAIDNEAKRLGISFDDAMKRAIQETSRELQARMSLNPVARLFRFSKAH